MVFKNKQWSVLVVIATFTVLFSDASNAEWVLLTSVCENVENYESTLDSCAQSSGNSLCRVELAPASIEYVNQTLSCHDGQFNPLNKRYFYRWNDYESLINNGESCHNIGNPINIAQGNKFYKAIDYQDDNFILSRYYNSTTGLWSFNYRQGLSDFHIDDTQNESNLTPFPIKALPIVRPNHYNTSIATKHVYRPQPSIGYDHTGKLIVSRPDGSLLEFINDGTMQYSIPHRKETLREANNTYELLLNDRNNTKEVFNQYGQLISVEKSNDQTVNLEYGDNLLIVTKGSSRMAIYTDNLERITQIALPDQSTINYSYQAISGYDHGRLVQVIYQNLLGEQQLLYQYLYEDTNNDSLISGVIDENKNRISTVQYDDQGRAISSEKGPLNSGIERSQIAYHADGSRTVTNALGKQTTYHFTQFNGEYKMTNVEGHPSENCAGANKAYTYDANGFLASKTDWKGNTTTYVYNDRGQETSRTEAFGTPEARTITTEWHGNFNLPVRIIEPEREVFISYDDNGRLLSRQILPRS